MATQKSDGATERLRATEEGARSDEGRKRKRRRMAGAVVVAAAGATLAGCPLAGIWDRFAPPEPDKTCDVSFVDGEFDVDCNFELPFLDD